MSPCGVGSPVHLDNQPASTVATLASVKPTVIRYISLLIPTELDNAYVDKEQDKFFRRVNRQQADINALKEWMERSELRARALELENESLSARLDSMVDKLCFCTWAEVTSQVVGSELSN